MEEMRTAIAEALNNIKAYAAAGFPSMFGFPVYREYDHPLPGGLIAYPTIGYRGEIGSWQKRHRPRSFSQPMTGRLSYQGSGRLQRGQSGLRSRCSADPAGVPADHVRIQGDLGRHPAAGRA